MGLILLDSKTHLLLRKLVHHVRDKDSLPRDPSNNDIIFSSLELLAKHEGLK